LSGALRVVRVLDAADARLAGFALAARPTELAKRGWFVAEGRLVVERLLADDRYQVEALLLNESALGQLEPVLQRRGLAPPLYVCPPSLFEELTGYDFHRGCLGLARRPEPSDWRALARGARTLIVLEAVANVDNVGGVFRNAAAFGADAVLLAPGCADPLYRKAIRTSMAASLRVPFATLGAAEGTWPDCLTELAGLGFELLALTPAAAAQEIDAYAATPGRAARIALLLGAEGPGLSAGALGRAQRQLRIAMRAEVDSLNLAVACGIALQRLTPR
jgi:tRNA G18 (ribose-2'-O)-methylase SpoU